MFTCFFFFKVHLWEKKLNHGEILLFSCLQTKQSLELMKTGMFYEWIHFFLSQPKECSWILEWRLVKHQPNFLFHSQSLTKQLIYLSCGYVFSKYAVCHMSYTFRCRVQGMLPQTAYSCSRCHGFTHWGNSDREPMCVTLKEWPLGSLWGCHSGSLWLLLASGFMWNKDLCSCILWSWMETQVRCSHA